MNVSFFSSKFSVLALGVSLALAAGTALAQQPAGPAGTLPQPQAAPAPSAAPLSPTAVNAIQQNIGAQPGIPAAAQPLNQAALGQVGQAAPAPQSGASRVMALSQSGADESTLLREVARYQAQLSLMNIVAKIEKSRLDMERERMKFEQEQLEAKAKAAPVSAPAAGASQGSVGGGSPSGAVPVEIDAPKPSVRSIYSFDGKSFAEIVVGGNKVLAEPGTVLLSGERVVSISPSAVVVSRKGRQVKLPLDGSASTSSQAVAPFAAPTSLPSGALPPIPPSVK